MFSERTYQARIIQEELRSTDTSKYVQPAEPSKLKLLLLVVKKKAASYLVIFLDTSSIHGLNHLVAAGRHPLEVLLWLALVILSVFGSVYLSSTTWERYQSSPTVVSMDRDMFAWNTTFPCVTICPHWRIDEKKLEQYAKDSPVEDKTAFKKFIMQLSNSTYKNFEDLPDYDPIPPTEYLPALLNNLAPFAPTLTIGASGILLKVQPTITEMGLCYAINSKVAEYNSPEYRKANRWDLIKHQNETFFVHPLDGEVFAQVINLSTAYDVYIHGPLEVPDISTKFQHSAQDFYMKMYVTALTVYTSPEAAKLSVAQRRCRFITENPLKHNSVYTYTMCRMECRIRLSMKYCGCIPYFYRRIAFITENPLKHNSVYTYTMCRMECRIRLSMKYCGCIPYFYRRIGDEKICNVSGMHCLARHRDELYKLEIDKDKKKINCGCYPICDDVNYVIQSYVLQEWFLGTNLQWGIVTYPRMRYRRDIIFGFTDVLVAVGSMAGLFLGCSVLSFMEIVYFLTLRLFFYTKDAFIKKT